MREYWCELPWPGWPWLFGARPFWHRAEAVVLVLVRAVVVLAAAAHRVPAVAVAELERPREVAPCLEAAVPVVRA